MPKAREPKPESESESEVEESEEGSDEEQDKKASSPSFKPPPRTEGKDGKDDKADEAGKADKAEEEKAKEPPKPFMVEFRPHTDYPPLESAVAVVYCPTCGLPPDFCQFGPSWDKCKPWCMEHFPHYYPELSGASLADAKKSAEQAQEKSKVKELPGGKKKREASPHITIKKLSRGGRKCVTSVTGLEGFGVKMDALAKVFKKKFSCGVAVVKGDPGQSDSVDIQGDFEVEVIEAIQAEYKDIPRSKFTIAEGGNKKKGKSKN